jgi:hypothetical protein
VKFYADHEEVRFSSSEELVDYLTLRDGEVTSFVLQDSENALTLEATCVADCDDGGAYTLNLTSNSETKECFASPRGNDIPSVEWVSKHFKAFYEGNIGWREYFDWGEAVSFSQTIKNLV